MLVPFRKQEAEKKYIFAASKQIIIPYCFLRALVESFDGQTILLRLLFTSIMVCQYGFPYKQTAENNIAILSPSLIEIIWSN